MRDVHAEIAELQAKVNHDRQNKIGVWSEGWTGVGTIEECMTGVNKMRLAVMRANLRRIAHCRDCGAEIMFLKKLNDEGGVQYHVPVDLDKIELQTRIWHPRYGRHKCVASDSTRVFVDRDIWRDALAYSAQVKEYVKQHLPKRNYTGQEARDRYAKGYIGEWAFIEWCKANELWYEHEFKVGMFDSWDVKMCLSKEYRLIDVKAQFGKGCTRLSIPVRQFEKHTNVDAYVAVHVKPTMEGRLAFVKGFVTRKQFDSMAERVLRKFGSANPAHVEMMELPYTRLPIRMSRIARCSTRRTATVGGRS